MISRRPNTQCDHRPVAFEMQNGFRHAVTIHAHTHWRWRNSVIPALTTCIGYLNTGIGATTTDVNESRVVAFMRILSSLALAGKSALPNSGAGLRHCGFSVRESDGVSKDAIVPSPAPEQKNESRASSEGYRPVRSERTGSGDFDNLVQSRGTGLEDVVANRGVRTNGSIVFIFPFSGCTEVQPQPVHFEQMEMTKEIRTAILIRCFFNNVLTMGQMILQHTSMIFKSFRKGELINIIRFRIPVSPMWQR